MREILFRGKIRNGGQWIEGSFKREIVINEKVVEVATIVHKGTAFEFPVDPETVGQYTGLTDKNGKRIFEGDILRYGLFNDYECFLESVEYPDDYDGELYDEDIEIDVVEWCGERYDYPAFDLKDHQFECNGLSQIMCGDYEYEIIGNIHDNPELLEGER